MAVVTILSDSPFFPTGYSNQARQLADYLSRHGHQVHYMANGYQGTTIKMAVVEDGTIFNYTIHGQKKSVYFADCMTQILRETKTDFFIILLDTFMLHGDMANPTNGWFLRIDTSPAQTAFWFPSDGGGGLPAGCDLILKKVEHPVAMAQFGQKQIQDYHGIKSDYIPHGLNVNDFKRLSDQERIQLRKTFPVYTIAGNKVSDLADKFVIGVVARNQQRKMVDRTIKTMNIVKDRIPNAVLLLHMDADDPAQIWDLRKLAARHNIENRIRFTGMSFSKGFDVAKVNQIYNMMDCFFLSTSGEGFGIPLIESMACEIPVVATDYTTTPELIIANNAGFGAKLAGVETVDMFGMRSEEYDLSTMNGTLTGGWAVERGLVDIKDAADKICQIATNPILRKQMSENGRKAVLAKYDFEKVIGPAWDALIRSKLK